jgi:hypothetical protein
MNNKICSVFSKKRNYLRAKKNPAFGGVFDTLVNLCKRQSVSRLRVPLKKKK